MCVRVRAVILVGARGFGFWGGEMAPRFSPQTNVKHPLSPLISKIFIVTDLIYRGAIINDWGGRGMNPKPQGLGFGPYL